MKTSLIAALAFLATAAAVVAPTSNAAEGDCDAALTIDIAGTAYLSQDEDGIPLVDTGFWVYAESNGQPMLQRGGVTLIGEADSFCQRPNPDLGIF